MVPDNLRPSELDDPVDDAFEEALAQVRLWAEIDEQPE